MGLNDLPEEILSLILSKVYHPWWIQIKEECSKGEYIPTISAKPAAPWLAPLLVSTKFHRIGKNMPMHSFNGLLDIRIEVISTVLELLTERTYLLPLVSHLWLGNQHPFHWNYLFRKLPSLSNVEVFNVYRRVGQQTPGELVGNTTPPPWMDPGLKIIFQTAHKTLCAHGNQRQTKLQIILHVSYLYKPDATFFGSTEQSYGLVYRIPRETSDSLYDLLAYRQKLTIERSGLCWTVPAGVS